jgi:hypothetical protein
MSSVLYQYTGCSHLISGPQDFVCSCPVVFTQMYLQGLGLHGYNRGKWEKPCRLGLLLQCVWEKAVPGT